MSQRYLGGIITANQNTTNSGLYTPALGAATPGVWTLSQANKAAAQRSWNMYDPYFPATTGVVHGIGTNGGTNNTFLDSSANNFTVTRNGNVTQGSFTPFSKTNGYWSNFFDGSGDYLQIAGNSNLAFGTNDFTIECFFFCNGLVGFIYDGRTSGVQNVPCLFISGSAVVYYVGGTTRITSQVITIGRWYHLVLSRVSNLTRLFLNGIQSGSTYFDSTTYINNTDRPRIGVNGDSTNSYFSGYITNMRVLNGTGITPVSIPTAPFTPDEEADTQLLTCQSSSFVDNSPNAFVLTKTGDVRVMEYSPFYYPYAYDPTVNGGGMFFDGTGDYLTLTGSSNLAFGANEFTIECFVYFTSVAADQFIYDSRPTTTNGVYPTLYLRTADKKVSFYVASASRILSDVVFTIGQWYHIVVSRVSGTTRMFIDGVAQTSTYADTNNYLNGASRPSIGASGYDLAVGPAFVFISNLRVLNGTGATSVTVPTAPFTPEEDANTQLLLSGTNAAIFDNASNLTIETINASISTANSKFGGSSIYFNGTNALARIRTPILGTNISYALPLQGNFTVECWFNLTSIAPAASSIICLNSNTASYAALRINVYSNGQLTLLASTSGSAHTINTGTATGLITANNWFHLAVVRQQGSFLVYVNGIQRINSTTIAATTSLMNGTENFLGGINNGGYQLFMPGYINDFRITNYARYLGQFTPPTSTLQNQ